jgi:hypothetical protein
LLEQTDAIGAGDVLRPSRLQIICGSAMRKQDRPKPERPPCAKLRLATPFDSIGEQVAVRASMLHIDSRLAGMDNDGRGTG